MTLTDRRGRFRGFAGIIGLTDLVRALDDPESMRLVKSGIASASWGV